MSIQQIRAEVRMRLFEIDPQAIVPDQLIDQLADCLARGEEIVITVPHE